MAANAKAQADYHERIIRDPDVLVGKPVIKGTRIPVSLILNLLAHGYDFGRIVEAYPQLTEDDIVAALAYAGERMEREELRPLKPAP